MELSGKKVLILGLGVSGQESAVFCRNRNAAVTVTDIAFEKDLNLSEEFLQYTDIKKKIGFHNVTDFEEADIIIISPGVSEKIEPVMAARKKGVKIIGEIELAYKFIDTPVIGITGTNGKSTVTTLIGDMLKLSDKKVFVGGNLGDPLIKLLNDKKKEKLDFIVAEISSFQLDTIETFKPFIGVLLNITKDHLDRYDSYLDYAKSKIRLFENQDKNDFAVLNIDDSFIAELCKDIKSRKIFFNTKNTEAAAAAAEIAGADKNAVYSALKNFKGLPHRIEYVDEIDGIRFFDDSKGTNTGAVKYALEKFSEPIILIMGGRDKKGGYSSLIDSVKTRVKKIIAIGEAKDAIYEELNKYSETVKASSLEEAVLKAYSFGDKKNVVLLSPACSSYDMFKNYKERGKVFCDSVKKLKREKGLL